MLNRLTLTALACLSLAACKEQTVTDPLELLGTNTEWQITEIAGTAVPEGVKVTMLRPEVGMLAGASGCNRYTGPAKTNAGKIEIGALAGTRMMCPEPQMQAETAFHSTIGKVTGLRQAGEVLEFTDAAGTVVLRAHK